MTKITKIEPIKAAERKKLRVAAYCRVSTNMDDQLESLSAQRQHYEKMIRANLDWTYAGIYYDEGITATKKDNRPELLRLLEDCRENKVDLVLSKSISRFSRNTTDCLEMVRSLTSCGVGIFFERENINTLTMEDEFILTVLGSLAENESLSISENEKWSVQKKFMKGTFRQAMAPYGYALEDGGLMVNEETAPVVRFIFDEALTGKGAHKIVKELNAKGIPSPLTDHWNVGTVKSMLQNERYVGDVLYQKTYSDQNFVRHVNRGECDQYLHYDHHQAIIPREQFERVQDLIALHRQEKSIGTETQKYQERYAFSGKIVCGECGAHLKRRIVYGRVRGSYVSWVCGTHLKSKDSCSMKAISEETIKDAFTTVTNKLIFSRQTLLEPFVKSVQGSNAGDVGKQIEVINRKLDENTAKAQTLINLAAQKLLDPVTLREAQAELKTARTEMHSQMLALNTQMQTNFRGVSEGGKLLKKLQQMMPSQKFDETFFTEFVNSIHVYSLTELGFEFTCGLVFREVVKTK